jgi:hypothetical protein
MDEILTTPPGIPEPPADELARVVALLEARRWIFAKTMRHNPHWYTLRKEWGDHDGPRPADGPEPSRPARQARQAEAATADEEFCWVVHWIRKWGFDERFPPKPAKGGRKYRVMILNGFKYWTMGCPCKPGPFNPGYDTILINRKPVTDEARARSPVP